MYTCYTMLHMSFYKGVLVDNDVFPCATHHTRTHHIKCVHTEYSSKRVSSHHNLWSVGPWISIISFNQESSRSIKRDISDWYVDISRDLIAAGTALAPGLRRLLRSAEAPFGGALWRSGRKLGETSHDAGGQRLWLNVAKWKMDWTWPFAISKWSVNDHTLQ